MNSDQTTKKEKFFFSTLTYVDWFVYTNKFIIWYLYRNCSPPHKTTIFVFREYLLNTRDPFVWPVLKELRKCYILLMVVCDRTIRSIFLIILVIFTYHNILDKPRLKPSRPFRHQFADPTWEVFRRHGVGPHRSLDDTTGTKDRVERTRFMWRRHVDRQSP